MRQFAFLVDSVRLLQTFCINGGESLILMFAILMHQYCVPVHETNLCPLVADLGEPVAR